MTTYVTDTSIVAKYLIEEPETPYADRLFAGCIDTRFTVWVPDYCFIELTNILWKAVVFRDHSRTLANLIVNRLHQLPVSIADSFDLLPRALEIGSVHKMPVYDGLFIALADELTCPLITTDANQSLVAQNLGVSIKPLADF